MLEEDGGARTTSEALEPGMLQAVENMETDGAVDGARSLANLEAVEPEQQVQEDLLLSVLTPEGVWSAPEPPEVAEAFSPIEEEVVGRVTGRNVSFSGAEEVAEPAAWEEPDDVEEEIMQEAEEGRETPYCPPTRAGTPHPRVCFLEIILF